MILAAHSLHTIHPHHPPCASSSFLMASITLFQADVYDRMSPPLSFLLVGFGLPGMLVMMQLAQLAPQVLASRHTQQFLDIPGGQTLVRIALGIELLGITECANAVRLLVEWGCCASSTRFMRVPSTPCAASSEQAWKAVAVHPSDVEDGAVAGGKHEGIESGSSEGGAASTPTAAATATATVTMNPLLNRSAK